MLEITLLSLLPSANMVAVTQTKTTTPTTPTKKVHNSSVRQTGNVIPIDRKKVDRKKVPPKSPSPVTKVTNENSPEQLPPDEVNNLDLSSFSLKEMKAKVCDKISSLMAKSFLRYSSHIVKMEGVTVTIWGSNPGFTRYWQETAVRNSKRFYSSLWSID